MIAHSAVSLYGQHASESLRTQQATLRTWVGERRPDFEGASTARRAQAGVVLSVSAAARAAAQASQARVPVPQLKAGLNPDAHTGVNAADAVQQADDAVRNDPRMQLIAAMVEALTGRAVRVFDARELQQPVAAAAVPAQPAPAGAAAGGPPAPVGWGLEYDAHEFIYESEFTGVSASGLVRTADGQEIRFELQLEMRREFVQETNVSIRAGDAVRKDPLVINFGGTGVELADSRFAFDIDADGQQDQIAFVAGGSGFLALDKNGDGRINDGTELFGTRSGDGFADLAGLDDDANQWIDANDAVYQNLRVWQRDANGQEQLGTLAEHGVGALYLGHVASPFSVNNSANQTLGLVRSSSVFLYESGQVGSLQQVDL